MKIRNAEIDDALVIMEIRKRSVLQLCRSDYSPEQLKEWVGDSTEEEYRKRLELHRAFVAEVKNQIVGYVRWNPETNELCSIFVDPDYVRQGIATKLMKTAYRDMREQGVRETWLDASITAVTFYEVEGWQFVEERMHGHLECVRMIKKLN